MIPIPALPLFRFAFRSFAASNSLAAHRPTSPWTSCHAFSTSIGRAPGAHIDRGPQQRQDHRFSGQKGVRVENGTLRSLPWPTSTTPWCARPIIGALARAPTDLCSDRRSSGEEFVAAFANFPGGFGQPWQVITLTPIDDFVGTLKRTNRLMMVVIIVLTMVELFFIYFASSRLSRPVENVSRQLQAIESLNFEMPARRPSRSRRLQNWNWRRRCCEHR